MKRLLFFLTLLISLTALLAGCAKTDNTAKSSTQTLTYKNETFTVASQPQHIAVLSNSLLQMLYAVDGTAIARVETSDKLPPEMEKLPVLGHTANINMEKLTSLKPDLVLGLKSQHSKLESLLKSNNMSYMLINYDGINDNIPLLTFLGQLTGHEDKAKEVIKNYQEKIDKVIALAKSQTPAKVAVLRATGKDVTAETSSAITASMVKELGMENVILNHPNLKEDSKTVPYSLESLAADDPDIIFIVTMGKKDVIDKTMQKEMTGNPAWNQLKAVKNQKVFYLEPELFLLNPGLQTPEAMAKLVKLAYGVE